MGPSEITVAVPTMNGSRHLAGTLRSILDQQGASFDLLVCDDRSDDDTLSVVDAAAGDRVRVLVNGERLGLAGNWNRCVAEARTPLVAIVHQDDLLLPGHLERHVGSFQRDPSVGLVASASVVVDDAGKPVPASAVGRGGLGDVDRTFTPAEALPALAVANPLRCSAVSMRVRAHLDSGGFDPRLRYVVDWDHWLRTIERWSLAWHAQPSVAVRWHPASETHRFRTGTLDLEETERLLEALHQGPLAHIEGRREIERLSRRSLARAYLNRAYTASRAGDGRLAWDCLARALRLQPAILGTLLLDPRLVARLAAASLLPRHGRN